MRRETRRLIGLIGPEATNVTLHIHQKPTRPSAIMPDETYCIAAISYTGERPGQRQSQGDMDVIPLFANGLRRANEVATQTYLWYSARGASCELRGLCHTI